MHRQGSPWITAGLLEGWALAALPACGAGHWPGTGTLWVISWRNFTWHYPGCPCQHWLLFWPPKYLMVLHQAVATIWNTHMFSKHNCALIPFNSADSTQLFGANGCSFSCKIACKYNRSYNGKWTNTFLSTSEMSHLSSGLCTESWHQMISFISFTVKLNLSQAPNCWEHKWRVSFPPSWEWKKSWWAGLSLSGFNLCGACLKCNLMAVSSPNTQAR